MTARGLPPRFYAKGFYFVWRDDGTEIGKKNVRLMASRLSGQPIWDDSPIPKKPSAIREAHNLIFSRVFDKRAPRQHLNWWIESCPSESPGVLRFFWVSVYGNKRGTEALKALRADGINVGLIEGVIRRITRRPNRKRSPTVLPTSSHTWSSRPLIGEYRQYQIEYQPGGNWNG